MAYDTNNVFAKILRHEIPTDALYEDEYALAFRDIAPQAPVHILVIPKGAYTDFADFVLHASDEEQKGYFKAVQKVAASDERTANGFRLIMNTGKASGQAVPHFHTHILAGRKLSEKID